jgi:hypothetical protein
VFFAYGGAGRPRAVRLPRPVADAFRRDLKARLAWKKLTLKRLWSFAGGDLKPRGPRWMFNALDSNQELSAAVAIEIAERARNVGVKMTESILTQILQIAVPEPAVIIMPRESARLASFLCRTLLGKPTTSTRRVEQQMRRLFEGFENANAIEPVYGFVTRLSGDLGSPKVGESPDEGPLLDVARQLARLRNAEPSFLTHGGKGRPRAMRVSKVVAEAFRRDLEVQRTLSGVTVEKLRSSQGNELKERSERWMANAPKKSNELPAPVAIEIASRARHLGIQLSESILEQILQTAVPEPAVIIMPRESARFAQFICRNTLGKPTNSTRRVEQNMRKLFERFEEANVIEPVCGYVSRLAAELGDPLVGRTLFSEGVALKVARELGYLRAAVPVDQVTYTMKSQLVRLSNMRRHKK